MSDRMTKEEAAEILETSKVYRCAKARGQFGILSEAMDIGIKALKQPERPKGRWDKIRCSECGQVDWTKPNFCPNCGSDNRGEEE